MAEVYDFFGKKKQAPPTYEEGMEAIETRGEYLGKIPRLETEVVRFQADRIERMQGQLNQLISEFSKSYDDYIRIVAGVLVLLDIQLDSVDLHTQDLYVDENGDAWLVTRTEAP